MISFRIDWLDLLAVQGTLKNLLQQHNSKASVLQCSTMDLSLTTEHKEISSIQSDSSFLRISAYVRAGSW